MDLTRQTVYSYYPPILHYYIRSSDGHTLATCSTLDDAILIRTQLEKAYPDKRLTLHTTTSEPPTTQITIRVDTKTLQQRIIQWWAERLGPNVSTELAPVTPTDIRTLLGINDCTVILEQD